MSQSRFESIVESLDIPGSQIETIYGQTSKNQLYAIIINNVAWYAVRLVLEVDERIGECVFVDKISEHLTLSGAKDKCADIKSDLAKTTPLHPLYKRFVNEKNFFLSCIHEVPKEVLNNPDIYLKPGDHIRIYRFLYSHEAIYIGNRKVIQVPDTTNPIREDSWEAFLGDQPKYIKLYVHLLKSRTTQEITDTAKSFIGKRGKEYDLLYRNCQHFSFFCSTGVESCPDVDGSARTLYKNKKGNEVSNYYSFNLI